MIQRKIAKAIMQEGIKYPVITIMGPRQSGKTTLCKMLFPTYTYANLEQLDMRSFANKDPVGFFKMYKPPIILDEIQNCPSLLSQVQVLSDQMQMDAQFIITGSQQLALSEAISQSLAGRTAIFTLLPFSLQELSQAGILPQTGKCILSGGMPRVFDKQLNPAGFYRDYIRTYIERDVRTLLNVKNLDKFELFLSLLAGRTGQLVNFSSMSGDVGVSSATLAEWFSVLEASNIVFKLTPWYGNIGKRLVKTPKVYFTDTGIPCSLLAITDEERLLKDNLRGHLFENLVILEALKSRYNANKAPSLHFFRTDTGIEIDLIDQRGDELVPYEIKSSDTLVDEFFSNLDKSASFLKNLSITHGGLIYAGSTIPSYKNWRVWNYTETGILFD